MIKRDFLPIEDSDVLLIIETVSLDEENSASFEFESSEIVQLKKTNTEKENIENGTDEIISLSETPVSCDWDVEKYRNRFEPDSHWKLRRAFIELHKSEIPEEELVPLAQAFVNVEVMRSVYSEDLMERLQALCAPLNAEMVKEGSSKRTLISASEAARDWVHKVPEGYNISMRRHQAIKALAPVFPIKSIDDVFRNFILLDDNVEESAREFDILGCGQFMFDVRMQEHRCWKATATVSGIQLSTAVGTLKKAKFKCREEVLNLLRKKCYKIKTNPNRYWENCNVERLEVDGDLDMNGDAFENRLRSNQSIAKDQLKEDNIGYKMLKKLGWGGGPLGKHKDGIVDPIEVQAKRGRRGLGLPQLSRNASDCSDYQFTKTGIDLASIPFRIDVNFYKDLMRNFKARQLGYDLIFSPDFTEAERTLLIKIANDMNLQCTTITYDYEHYQFVLLKNRISPHELLMKIIVDKHPVYSALYTVEPPDDGQEMHNKILELCSR